MKIRRMLDFRIVFVGMIIGVLAQSLMAETVYVNSRNGSDTNSGTKEKPLRTIGQAAVLVNGSSEKGPTTIKIGPGVYNLTKAVLFENTRPYTKEKRLTIEATVLPDDSEWKPALMPVLLSTEDAGKPDVLTETHSLKIKNSYVTIRGLKFLGNSSSNNWHGCIERIGKNLDDLLITQCIFIGDKDSLNIYCAALATGNRFVVDHCIFKNCYASVVYWDGFKGIGGKGCAMRYCIVDGVYQSGVWTCQTAEDFEFHHNITTRSEYFWIRKKSEKTQKYKLHDCIVTGNKYYFGYGVPSGPTGQTGAEISYEEKNVVKKGQVVLGKDKKKRNFLHPVPGTLGSDLGAGLFIMSSQDKSAQEPSITKKTYTYKKVDGHEILADVYLPPKNKVRPVIIYIHGWYMADSRHSLGVRGKALLNKLTEANYAVVSIDFRLAPETKLEQMIEDVKDACIWVREKGPELFNIDSQKVAVMGGSSGGTLALTAGHILKNPPQVVIAISGPGDLSWAGKSDGDKSLLEKKEKPYDIVGDKLITIGTHGDRYKLWPYLTEKRLYLWELLGFEPELEPDRFNALLPIKNFTTNYPLTLVVRSQGEGYADLKKHLDAKNIENEQFVVPDVHSIKIIGKYPEAGEKIVSFLDKHLKEIKNNYQKL